MSPSRRKMLDTNMVSHVVKGSAAVRARLLAVAMSSVCVSAITEGELRSGLAKRPEVRGLAAGVESFLLRVEILPWDSSAAVSYGRVRAALEAAGMPLGHLDTLIAAHALATDAILVTGDRAFARVQGLVVEDWARD